MQKFKIIGKPLLVGKYVEGKKERIEVLMTENEYLMMHSEELMRKLRNTDNSGRYVRPRIHNVCMRTHYIRTQIDHARGWPRLTCLGKLGVCHI